MNFFKYIKVTIPNRMIMRICQMKIVQNLEPDSHILEHFSENSNELMKNAINEDIRQNVKKLLKYLNIFS